MRNENQGFIFRCLLLVIHIKRNIVRLHVHYSYNFILIRIHQTVNNKISIQSVKFLAIIIEN